MCLVMARMVTSAQLGLVQQLGIQAMILMWVTPILDSIFLVFVVVLEARNEKGRCSHASSLYGKQRLFMHATAAIFDV
jgi:hypothetical protein